MTIVNGYCTAQELRDQLQDPGTNLSAALLDRAVNAASRAVDKHCGRRFWKDAAVTVRHYRPTRTSEVVVDDIADRTGVIVATDESLNASYSTVWSATDFELSPRNADVVAGGDTVEPFAFTVINALYTAGRIFPVCTYRPTVQVTAKFGWSSVPDNVSEATLLKAAALFKRKDAPFGVAGFGEFGAVRITRADADVVDLLRPFRRFYNRPEV